MKGVVAALMAAMVAVIVWAFVEMGQWEDRCNDAGGEIESRFIGYTSVVVGNPPVVVNQPNYSYHCMLAGQEIEV